MKAITKFTKVSRLCMLYMLSLISITTALWLTGCFSPSYQVRNPDKSCYELYKLVHESNLMTAAEIVNHTPVWFKELARRCGNE